MIPILLALLLSGPIPADSLLLKYGPYSHFVTDTIAQPWWGDVLILNLYPTSTMISPNADGLPDFRVALDADQKVYRIWGTETIDIDEFLDRHPAAIDSSNARDYGWFYINLTQFFEYDYIFLVEDADTLVAQNLRLNETRSGRPRISPDSVERAIRNVLPKHGLNRVNYEDSSGSWVTDYYLWREATGGLELFRLKIGRTGRCDILQHEILATKLGYYRSLIY